MLLIISLAMGISLVFLVLALVISRLSWANTTKPAPFECGFEQITEARLTFSMKFYMIVIIFLVFDVEIALMLPIPALSIETLWLSLFSCLFMVIILILGTLLELEQGALFWLD